MSAHTKTRAPTTGTFAFLAGEYLYKVGPAPERDLFAEVRTDLRLHERAETLQGVIRSGWLTVAQSGHIECSAIARAHYDQLAGVVEVKYVGQIAAPREAFNAYDRPPLRKAYMPNSRGLRQDVLAWSVRPAGFGFKNAGGGDV
jgi:hypothetical protein